MYGIENLIPEVVKVPFFAVSLFFVIQLIFVFVGVVIKTPQGKMDDNTWGVVIADRLGKNICMRLMSLSYIVMCLFLGLYALGINLT